MALNANGYRVGTLRRNGGKMDVINIHDNGLMYKAEEIEWEESSSGSIRIISITDGELLSEKDSHFVVEGNHRKVARVIRRMGKGSLAQVS